MFHIEDVPPPTTEAPLCERLEPLSEDSNSVASLVDRFLAFNQQTNSLKRWLEMFGVEQKNRQLIQTIDANSSKQEVSFAIERILNEIMD